MSRAAVVTRGSLLASVPLLRGVPEAALDTLAREAEVRAFPSGAKLVSELETGDEALIVLDGTGRATVGGMRDDLPVEIGEVGPGDCVGEMALFTGDLRSATVVAKTPMAALVLDRPTFLRLMSTHPTIARHLAGILADRLNEADRLLARLLDPSRTDAERRDALRQAGGASPKRASARLATAVRVAWQEGVARHRQDLPFLMLVSFVAALVSVRAAILLERTLLPGVSSLENLLRASYVAGLLLLCGSGIASLLLFRPAARKRVAALFGVGLALLFNSLSVLLTFDLFYRDIRTPDPNLTFSVETLYARAEGSVALAVTAALLGQAVYLRRFYRRLFSIGVGRLLRALGRA